LARKGSFGTSLSPFGGETDLSKYEVVTPAASTTGSAAPMRGGSAADQLAMQGIGSDYGQDFGSDYWNSLLTNERWSASSALEAKAMADARAAGDWDLVLQIRQGGGFGPGGLGSSIQQQLVDSGQQMWVGDQGVTSPYALWGGPGGPWGGQPPPKPTVAPEAGIMPQPVIPQVELGFKVAPPKAYTDLRAFMGVPIRG
jgi:hypothetical protein